jgi:hypothetical protein
MTEISPNPIDVFAERQPTAKESADAGLVGEGFSKDAPCAAHVCISTAVVFPRGCAPSSPRHKDNEEQGDRSWKPDTHKILDRRFLPDSLFRLELPVFISASGGWVFGGVFSFGISSLLIRHGHHLGNSMDR